ncbi:integrase catalytic domain-containing protein [Trichonephila clavipes]|nr:integrase catalytic domain-containing protein [Trichonephila clavipes]
MQRLWKQQLQWDERVPPDITLEWEQLAKDVQLVKEINIPRFLFVDSDNQVHLFGFSDASEKAYAAAIYCRSVSDTEKNQRSTNNSQDKSCPAETCLTSSTRIVSELYPTSQTQFYTDSTIVLAWVGSHASRWKTFVANRVAKIQTLSSAIQWHHISGSANTADLATRGVSSSTLLTSIWLCGPKFLHETFPIQTDSSVFSLNDAVPKERLFKYSRGGRSFATCKSRIRPQTSHLTAKRHILTDLIVRHYHEILLHAGTQLVKSCIQEQYWIIGARDVIRHLIRKCIKCCKVRASITNQMMSDLPSSRISPAPAFMRCGVDYAGSFKLKPLKAEVLNPLKHT